MSKILDFSELLITKFCHDLAGVIGAVDNGVEFLEEMASEETRKKALELLAYSSSEAVSKLKFFRYIYGMSSNVGETDLSDIKTLVSNYYEKSKHKFHWKQGSHDAGVVQLTSRASKLLCNIIYLLSEAMITAGEISIEINVKGTTKEFSVIGKSQKFKDIKAITQILSSHELRDISLESVQIHLTSKIATSLDVVLGIEHGTDYLKISSSF